MDQYFSDAIKTFLFCMFFQISPICAITPISLGLFYNYASMLHDEMMVLKFCLWNPGFWCNWYCLHSYIFLLLKTNYIGEKLKEVWCLATDSM